jgi:hypothetical protein
LVPCLLESEKLSKESRKNWARLIQKIPEADTLRCPKRHGTVRVISSIEQQDVIEKTRRADKPLKTWSYGR